MSGPIGIGIILIGLALVIGYFKAYFGLVAIQGILSFLVPLVILLGIILIIYGLIKQKPTL